MDDANLIVMKSPTIRSPNPSDHARSCRQQENEKNKLL